MKKAFVLSVFAALTLACQSQAAHRWSFMYDTAKHHAFGIITTGDLYSEAGGYPIINISGERDGVPIDGPQHGYVMPAFNYEPYNATTNPYGGTPRYVLTDGLLTVNSPPDTFTEFDNLIFVVGGKAQFDFFGLSYNAGGLEYNVCSDGTTVWELDYANVAATGGQGDVVTHFLLSELPIF